MKFYSQFKQDEFLFNSLFLNKNEGYFVDIGAYDGITDSNSLFFENLGWKGICFEPNPIKFEQLKNNRKCECYPYAVSHENKISQFFQINPDGPDTLNGLVDEYTTNAIERINKYNLDETQNFNYIDVECRRLDSILKTKNIDYLSIDTEGNELKILNTIDFNNYHIKAITVENNNYDNTFLNFFSDKNFSFVRRLGCDEVYINLK